MTRELSHSGASRPGQGRGGALDALRFVAALLIVLYHYGADAPSPLAALHPVFARGHLATDFFLMLSGFVLGRAYGAQILGGRIGLVAFLRKRITRVWPGQLIVLAAMGAVVGLALLVGLQPQNPEHYRPTAMLMQVFLVQAWGVAGGDGWNQQSWSLSALIACYALFPLLWRAVSRVSSPVALFAFGLATVMAGDLACRALFNHSIYDLGYSLGVIRAVPMFLLGVCIARIVEQGAPSVPAARTLAVLALAGLVLLQIAGRIDLPSIVAIALIVLSFGRLPVARPSALIEQGAKLSFALFITHALTGLVWFGALSVLRDKVALAPWMDWALWAGSVPAALVVAGLFHYLVDEPLQAWLNRRPARARAAAEAPSAA